MFSVGVFLYEMLLGSNPFMADNPDNQIFLRALLDLANGINVLTVAECVETADEARILREEGVDYLQGYYLGRPSVEQTWRAAATAGAATDG